MVVTSSDALELRLFDEQESELIARSLVALAKVAPADANVLSRLMGRLAELNRLVWTTASLRDRGTLGNEGRDQKTLVNHLVATDGLSGDLELPFKATLQRTFLLGKIQFLRAFVKATFALRDSDVDLNLLELQLREELAQSIYTQMAEELLLALLRKPSVKAETKRRAAEQLITIWDNATLEIDDFCPLLESAWHARNRVTPNLGSMIGATEYFRLVSEDCAPQFLDFFARDEVSDHENQAFSEFLFGLTWEEIVSIRQAMKEQGLPAVEEQWAMKVLGRKIDHELDDRATDRVEIDPVSLYRSYQRRQLAADYRILAGGEGPRRTAEAYLMIYLLDLQTS